MTAPLYNNENKQHHIRLPTDSVQKYLNDFNFYNIFHIKLELTYKDLIQNVYIIFY